MGKIFSELNEDLHEFIGKQMLFFTGTAPIEGRVNVSPKGTDCFRCLDNKTVAYLDMTGSGNETAAHVHENKRLTIMFCSFAEKPLILRLYGRGEVVKRDSVRWNELHNFFPKYSGERQIIVLHIESAMTSCGFGVPIAEDMAERDILTKSVEKRLYENCWRERNQTSIDGLPTFLL